MNSPRDPQAQVIARPVASLSLDLDDKWTYMKTHGDERWHLYPSYLNVVVPRVLSFLDKLSLRITFFIVGQDAGFSHNWPLLESIATAGHEIGNHSFHHEPWLHLYSRDEIEQELERSEDAIGIATGRRVTGFRGPGFSISTTVGEVLASRGYRYDASTLPTFLGPLARAYYMVTARLDKEEKRRRARLFGRFRDGFRPLKPWCWHTASGPIAEVPVTTMPFVRTPFHLSYLVWLYSHSNRLAQAYLNIALTLCRATTTAPSFLLHPLDFIDQREAEELSFFPGMKVPVDEKLAFAEYVLSRLADDYRLVTVGEHASGILPAVAAEAPVGISSQLDAGGVPQ
jgi:peptidoglycan/xylan/chitin deacetylase (PgdA/CDA1 family)